MVYELRGAGWGLLLGVIRSSIAGRARRGGVSNPLRIKPVGFGFEAIHKI